MPKLNLQQLGEAGLLARLAGFFSRSAQVPVGVGDDGAVLQIQGELVVTTDLLLEGTHFSPQTTPPHAIGWRAAAANLSDLAAMGAEPLGLLVGLGLPADTPVAWVEEVYRGLTEASPVPIVGGDTCRSQQPLLAITALGQVASGRAWLRSSCRVGDLLVVTGPLGASRAGLEALQKGYPDHTEVIRAHQYPQPRLDWVTRLRHALPAAMDTSDGLADALVQMAQQSGVGLVVDLAQIPISEATRAIAKDLALSWALYGGEDFELLLSLPSSDLQPGLIPIGRVVAEHPGVVMSTAGELLSRDQAFAHFG